MSEGQPDVNVRLLVSHDEKSSKKRKGEGKRLTDSDRLKIIRLKNSTPCPSNRAVAKKYNVSESCIRATLKNSEAILSRASNAPQLQNDATRRVRTPKYPVLEQWLFTWIDEEQGAKHELTPSIISEKARSFADNLGIENFKASWGWLHRFNTRSSYRASAAYDGQIKINLGGPLSVHAGIYQSKPWDALKDHVKKLNGLHLRDLIADDVRCASLSTEYNGILLDYSRQRVLPETMQLLFELSQFSGIDQKRFDMFQGSVINSTEGRAAYHVALRSEKGDTMCVNGVNVVPQVHDVLDRIADFSSEVRSGKFKGCTGKLLKNVISIGIGGSYLGPEFVYEALRTERSASEAATGRCLRFLANVDPIDVERALEGLDAEETLVVVVSKTFTTAETMLNAQTLKGWLIQSLSGKAEESQIAQQHIVAVSTSNDRCIDFGVDPNNIFGFWDWVGGRYSVCSAVGMLPLSLHYGFNIMKRFLQGAHDMDRHFYEAEPMKNMPMILGVLGVWNSTFLELPCRALLPYSQALLRFPAHIQQVDMESNGKRVDIYGNELLFEAGEIDFGEPGTNGQHSFYQLIHQGRVIPCDFIGFCKSPNPIKLDSEPVSNHDELMSNFFAQPDALACGKTLEELELEGVPESLRPHKVFPGNRPSSSLLFPFLDAYYLGQLLALYEHRTAVQGFIWGLNSFDQWGVELGKQLAKKVRSELSATRSGSNPSGFNPSTTHLLSHYLKHSASGNESCV